MESSPRASVPLVGAPFWLAFLACALVAICLPQLDLATSALFFDGQRFPLDQAPLLRFTHRAVEWLSWAIPAVLLGVIAYTSLGRSETLRAARRAACYLLLVLALGPGVLVNGLLKEHVPRARPNDIVDFGGPQAFSAPFLATGECASNCSFVSGHAAMGFYALSIAFVVPPRYRRTALVLGSACGVVTGGMRIAQGAHFLSDVVFAWFAVYLTAALCHRLLYGVPEQALPTDQASSRSSSFSP